MLLLIDNYDSFTYNLVQTIGSIDPTLPVTVVRNDKIDVDGVEALHPRWILLSPGPCTPTESGVCLDLIQRFRGRVPLLGVCLGHQAIGHVHGMIVRRHDVLMHGKTSDIHHDGRGVFGGLPNPFPAMRYHSLIVDRDTVAREFEVSAWTARGEVMGLRWIAPPGHASLDGVQFHPESFLTDAGPRLLANFLGRPLPGAADAALASPPAPAPPVEGRYHADPSPPM